MVGMNHCGFGGGFCQVPYFLDYPYHSRPRSKLAHGGEQRHSYLSLSHRSSQLWWSTLASEYLGANGKTLLPLMTVGRCIVTALCSRQFWGVQVFRPACSFDSWIFDSQTNHIRIVSNRAYSNVDKKFEVYPNDSIIEPFFVIWCPHIGRTQRSPMAGWFELYLKLLHDQSGTCTLALKSFRKRAVAWATISSGVRIFSDDSVQ